MTAYSVLGTDAQVIRHAGDLLGIPGEGKREEAGAPRKTLWISRQTGLPERREGRRDGWEQPQARVVLRKLGQADGGLPKGAAWV